MVDLLPCPFCDYDEARLVDRGEYPGAVFVKCNDCGAEGPPTGWGYPGGYQTRELAHEKAIEMWNKRATLHIKFTESEMAFTTINDKVFIPLEPKIQRLA